MREFELQVAPTLPPQPKRSDRLTPSRLVRAPSNCNMVGHWALSTAPTPGWSASIVDDAAAAVDLTIVALSPAHSVAKGQVSDREIGFGVASNNRVCVCVRFFSSGWIHQVFVLGPVRIDGKPAAATRPGGLWWSFVARRSSLVRRSPLVVVLPSALPICEPTRLAGRRSPTPKLLPRQQRRRRRRRRRLCQSENSTVS